ncbi:MAG: DAK2 domain-containing protein [Streptosporangiaceae bacterium]
MPVVRDVDGAVVRLWLRLAADELARARSAIDVLNVFPVADSDTGTNMARTIACAADALAALPEHASATEIWRTAADAALQGACGNSGIILSQLLCGLADTCGPASPCDGQVVALALTKAAALARAAVHRPVEGTVLTVADAAAEAAVRAAAQPAGLAEVGRAAALGASEALLGTRRQLDVLAASGVVDAGGAGLCVLLDALSAAIAGRGHGSFAIPGPIPWAGRARLSGAVSALTQASEFDYEVTFLLDAPAEAASALRDRLDLVGDSLVVSGREPLWHVHIHVADAGAAVEAGLAAGRLSKITVTYLNGSRPGIPPGQQAPPASGVIAIAEGAGMASLLSTAGAAVVDGGGCGGSDAALDELARASGPAVLLATSGRFAERWLPGWPVLEVGSEVQLLAALAVHDPGRGPEADLASMRRAVAGMRWASVRSRSPHADLSGVPFPGLAEPFVGAIAGQDVLSGRDQEEVARAMADLLIEGEPEMLTLVAGQAASPGLAALVTEHVASRDPRIDVVCYDGGMTSSLLLIGAE